MTVKTGQAWAGTFVTLDATGALATPSTGPAGVLYVDGTSNAATVTITGSNPYKWAVTLPTLTAGQRVDMYITATIATIATAGIVASEQADTTLASEVKTDTAAILADTGTDGVKIAGAQTVATVTNLTNLPSIPANWITAAGVATGAIDADAIASNAITSAKIATGAITNAKFASGAIDAAAIATDAIGSAEISAAAVTKIQSGLALEATLTAIKGAGWVDETLAGINAAINAGFGGDDLGTVLNALEAIKGAGWTDETLVKIVSDIAAISAGGATAQEVWEYATRVLTAGTNIDLSALATAADLATLDGKVDTVDGILDDLHDTDIPAIKAKTDNLPATPASAGEYAAAIAALQADLDNPDQYKANISTLATNTDVTDLKERIVAVDTIADAILEDTGTTIPATLATIAGYTDGIAGDVWSHPHRTLTNQGIDATSPASGDPLIIYRDTTVYISLTGLGNTTGAAGTKIFFTAKENLEDADSDSIIQLKCTRATPITDPDTSDLLYINKAAPTVATEGTFVFADHTDGTAEITIQDDAAADLPIYAATPLYWDVKMVTAAGVSTILSTGTMYIYGTPTRTII